MYVREDHRNEDMREDLRHPDIPKKRHFYQLQVCGIVILDSQVLSYLCQSETTLLEVFL
jgi:hypothetical protein